MDTWRDDRRHSGRARRTSRSPEGSLLRERDDARSRRDRGGGARGRRSCSRSRSAPRRRGGDRDLRRRSATREEDERGNTRHRDRSRSPRKRGRSPSTDSEQPRKKRSGFDQAEMLPENYAMQQLTHVKLQELTAMLPKAAPQPVKFNPRRIWDTLPTEITHLNPEVEVFLTQNEVHAHAANRLRALPLEVQTLVLERGSIRKSRDPTAVLMTRIRNAVTNPSQLWAPALGGLTGATPVVSVQTQPGSSDAATAGTQPTESSGLSAVTSTGAEGRSQGDGNHSSGKSPLALQDGSSSTASRWDQQAPAGSVGMAEDYKTHNELEWDKPWTKWLYGSETKQANQSTQQEVQTKREHVLDHQIEQVFEGAREMSAVSSGTKAVADSSASGQSETEKVESEAERQKREEMQSSIAATIASLSAKFLPKEKATKFLGTEEATAAGIAKAKAEDNDSEEDMDIDDDVDGPAAVKKAQMKTRLPASAPSNPFRSRPHAAPVSQQTDLEPAESTQILFRDSTGIETGMVPNPRQPQQERQHPSTAPNPPVVELAVAKAAPPQESPEEKKKRVEATARRAIALATLINYGLTDPDNEADLTKAVHAMAAATGDHATAVKLWQEVTGKESAQPHTVAVETPPQLADSITDFQNLSEQQQAEMQQAAAAAQYSQLWMQQQFQAQMALQEAERLMAIGDMPAGSLDGVFPQFGGKGKGKSGDKTTNWKLMLPGDWTCPGCGDHQFARNRVCRYCGTAKPLH